MLQYPQCYRGGEYQYRNPQIIKEINSPKDLCINPKKEDVWQTTRDKEQLPSSDWETAALWIFFFCLQLLVNFKGTWTGNPEFDLPFLQMYLQSPCYSFCVSCNFFNSLYVTEGIWYKRHRPWRENAPCSEMPCNAPVGVHHQIPQSHKKFRWLPI